MAKLCLLVGGSRGLGIALLEKYQQEQYESAAHVDLDLSKRETAIDSVDQAMAVLAKQDWDEVQLIVNAAMLSPIGPLSMSEPKQWWQHIDVNFTLPISIFGRFQVHFNAYKCKKIAAFVSSGASRAAFDGWSLYCASKAGVDHFLRSMALEQLRSAYPIQCAILDPGVMDTQMQACIRDATEEQFSQVERFQDRHAQGGLVDPHIVATNIYLSLSQPFDGGELIDVSGG